MLEMYLDANAHIPMNQKAKQAFLDFSSSKAGHGHPSSLSEPGRQASLALEEARNQIAQLIGAEQAGQIIFTSSCTQACQWGLSLFAEENLFSSPVEHTAVKDAVEQYCKNFSYLPIDDNGVIKLNDYSNQKVVCAHMQNEIGIIQPIEKLNAKAIFSDMSQSLGKVDLNVTKLNVDVAVFGAHKFGGPGGVGFLYLKDPKNWRPFGTGSRYFMDRTGTPDVAGIVASAAGLQEAIDTLPVRQQKMTLFQSTLEKGLIERGYEIIGYGAKRAWNTTYVVGLKNARNTLLELSNIGIHVGLGSACGSYSTNISPLIRALGRNEDLDNVMRISQWGEEYDEKEAQIVVESICRIENK